MKELHILFTGVGRRIELIQAFRQAALVLDCNLKIYGADMAGTAPALAYCDFTRKVCSMKDPAYIEELVEICYKDKIDLLIPTIDTDLLVLAKKKANIEAVGTKVMISAPDKILICRDKNNTSQFFVDCGLKAPMPVNDYKRYNGGYPAFIKPKDGSSSINAFKVETPEELPVYAEQIDEYIVQPFVDGTEYTIDIFCDFDGAPVYIIPRERMQVRAGEVLKTRICLDKKMIEEAKALIKKFKPCGPMTVQLIRDKVTGDDYYIEINPRFGGGAPLSMKAGARSAESVLRLISGEIVGYTVTGLSDGAVFSRFDQSVCIRDMSSMPTITDIREVRDHLENINGVIFDLDDTLYSEKQYVRSGYKAVAGYLGNAAYADKLWQYFEDKNPAIDALLDEIGQTEKKQECLKVYREHIPEITLFDGVTELISELRSSGKKVGIITDGRPDGQRNKLKALGLENVVDDIIITDELGGNQFRKPCDIAFRIMQCKWKLPFEQMVYVGDNAAKDFQAANILGMEKIKVCYSSGLYFDNNI